MNREDIIKLAREAELLGPEDTAFDIIEYGIELWLSGERGMQELERFAVLVAAAAKVEENEACAKLAETYREWDDTGMGIAAAIRARKENT